MKIENRIKSYGVSVLAVSVLSIMIGCGNEELATADFEEILKRIDKREREMFRANRWDQEHNALTAEEKKELREEITLLRQKVETMKIDFFKAENIETLLHFRKIRNDDIKDCKLKNGNQVAMIAGQKGVFEWQFKKIVEDPSYRFAIKDFLSSLGGEVNIGNRATARFFLDADLAIDKLDENSKIAISIFVPDFKVDGKITQKSFDDGVEIENKRFESRERYCDLLYRLAELGDKMLVLEKSPDAK